MAAELPVPVYTALSDVYPDLVQAAKQGARFNDLAAQYEAAFGTKPKYIARAPGRVNLIGEHIDYTLFGVFPAAIEQDILIACGPRASQDPGHVEAHNTYPKYTPQSFAPMLRPVPSDTAQKQDDEVNQSVDVQSWHLDINPKELRWESYVKAGYYGVLNNFFDPSTNPSSHPVPVNILVSGTVPAGSGLSSSAAMVVASTLAFLAINNKLQGDEKFKKGKLVQMAVENEKRVGVNSGGMDQAASILCTPNSALYITFFPSLAAELVSLPQASTPGEGVVLVCANSLVVSDKVVGAKTRYNLRVVETLVAAHILAEQLNLTLPKSPNGKPPTLREVLSAFIGKEEPVETDVLKDGLERILKEIAVLKASNLRGEGPSGKGAEEEDGGVTLEEMIKASGLNEAEFKKIYLSWVDVEATHFQLYKRTKHIYSESLRVLQFRQLCLASSSPQTAPTSPTEAFKALGELMSSSHHSCSALYECSCPELDELTQIARESGAYGSRLTGAGWGGCSVSLVPENKVDEFIGKVAARYEKFRGLEGEQLNEAIFATRPGVGAYVYELTD